MEVHTQERGNTFTVCHAHIANIFFLDSENQIATLDDGRKIKYGKCLIATGGQPKNLEAFSSIGPKHVTAYHNLQDFMHMEDLISNKKIQSVAVIGGGLLGKIFIHVIMIIDT